MAEVGRRFSPERQFRQPPRGRVDLGVSSPTRPGFRPGGATATPDRPTTAPTLPRPDQIPPVPEQRPKKPKTGTRARIALAGLAVVGAGAGAYEAYQNIPAVHQAVDSAFLDHLRGKSSEASINIKGVKPFNPNISTEDAQKVQIGAYTRPITEEEKQSFRSTPPVLKILPGELQPRANLMLPGDNLQPGDVVRVKKNYNPNVLSQITHKQENTMMGYDLTYNRSGIEISLSFIPGIDKAKKIEVYQTKPWNVNGKDYFTGVSAVITMADGSRLATSIGSSEDVRDIKPLIDNLPRFDPSENVAFREGKYYTPGLEVTPKIPLVATARSNAVVSVSFGGRLFNSNLPGLNDGFSFDSALKTDNSGNLLLNQK